MRLGRHTLGVSIALIAGLLASTAATEQAEARKRRRGGAMKLVGVNIADFAGIPLNQIIEFRFSQRVARSSINPASIQIRSENAAQTGFTQQVPGSFQVQGRVVRFYPRIATHMRDPDDPAGGFYPPGTPRDDANDNSGLQPGTNYEVTVVGHPVGEPVRSKRGRRLTTSSSMRFTTSPIQPREFAFTTETFQEPPPPKFRFSNPPDKVAAVVDQYARHGGTEEVPADVALTMFANQVPLSPTTVRQQGNVVLVQTERRGDPSTRKVIAGTPFIEQNFDTTRLVFQPRFPLDDVGVYALRVTKNVKDITEEFDFEPNAERLRLRAIYEFLNSARVLSPNSSPAELQDPPIDLITDWPLSPAERGVLKANVLTLGDTYPDEIDPRVMMLFSTRDEPVSRGEIDLEFVLSDGHFDGEGSTGSYDSTVPGAAAAIMTIAGGSAANGDYQPAANETIDTDTFTGNTINWRRLVIPPGVVVTLTGSRPAIIRALEIDVQGELRADGLSGASAATGGWQSGAPVLTKGGLGGPGGGVGADSANTYPDGTSTVLGVGLTGVEGHDVDLVKADPDDGGRGGEGGRTGSGNSYFLGAGGGGGGAKQAGSDGAPTRRGLVGWDGVGGRGGAGSTNTDLRPLTGAAGGGSGGNSSHGTQTSWRVAAGAAGGGGGGVRVQTSGRFVIGTQGIIRSQGGRGGSGSGSNGSVSAGPGGGGGGGSALLQTTGGFEFAAPASNVDVRGGTGGTSPGATWTAQFGGAGGEGYLRTEDPNGGIPVGSGSSGVFDPIGGGVSSHVQTKWIDVGVDDVRFLNFTDDDFSVAAINDAVLIEVQYAVQDKGRLGFPLLDSLNPDGSTSDPTEVSEWLPVRYIDNTGVTPAAIPNIPGYDRNIHGLDHTFDVAAAANGMSYRFVRVRITFQLDPAQSRSDGLPFIDRMKISFEFNF